MEYEENKINKNNLFFAFMFFLSTYLSINIKIIILIFISVILLIHSKFRIFKSVSLFFLICILSIGFFSGIFHQNNIFNMFRDLQYYIGPIMCFFIGTQLNLKIGEKINMIKIFIQYVILDSLRVGANIILNINSVFNGSFHNFREFTMGGELIVPLALIILLFKNDYDNYPNFKLKHQILVFFILVTRVIFSFSRTMIFSVLAYLVIFSVFKNVTNIRIKRGIGYFTLLITLIMLVNVIPQNFTKELVIKFNNSLMEISSHRNWNNYETIVQNWRGYENSVAQNLFLSGNIEEKLFGYGFGKLFPVLYSDLVGIPLDNGGITIIHNGYFFNIIKIGLLGLTLYFAFFISILWKAFSTLQNKTIYNPIVVSISLNMLISSVVIIGFFQRNFDIGFIIFFASCYINLGRKEKNDLSSYSNIQ